jgi:HlyD family secretion protein/adhesin transport system membrane fusion protein
MIDERSWNHRIVTLPIMAFMAVFIVWSIFSEVDEVVRGDGKVIPSSQTKVIQHLEGGIVDSIYVKEGQNVKKGDPIYRLKNASSQANSKKKEISLVSLSAEHKRVQAQVDFKDISQLVDLDDSQRDIFRQEMQNFDDEISGLKDKLSQSKLEKKQKSSRLKNLRNELKTASENLKISKSLLEKGAASKKQYLAELSKKQSLQTQISDIKSSIPIIDQKISEANNKIKSFRSQIKSKWLKKLSEIETKIKQLKEDKSAQKDRESRKVVTSPVNGIVQKLYFHTMGGIVKPGDRIAEITPVDDKLIIEAKIKTIDRGQVIVGQDVSIAITAYNYAKFGLLEGKLLSISPDSFSDKNGMSYYEVKVKADKYNFAKDKPILPGMVADINILTGKKTIFRYILKPLKDISKNALHEQ